MSRFFFFVQEAFRALRRNAAPSTAAIVTTVTTVILLGVLIPVLQTTQAKSDQIRGQLNFQVGLFADATQGEIASLQGKIREIPHVASVKEISKATALRELRDELGKKKASELTSELHENPLPNSLRITPDDPANLKSIETAVIPTGKSPPISPIVDNIFHPQEAANKIAQVTGALKIVLTVITALLIIASLMLVGNTIRLSIYTRRREVEVMRLVGATRWFIRWPFMIEGVVVGFTGGLLAILILWIGKITIVDPLSSNFSFLAAQNNSTLAFPALVAILFAAAVLVSAVGSGVTLRRFLKV